MQNKNEIHRIIKPTFLAKLRNKARLSFASFFELYDCQLSVSAPWGNAFLPNEKIIEPEGKRWMIENSMLSTYGYILQF